MLLIVYAHWPVPQCLFLCERRKAKQFFQTHLMDDYLDLINTERAVRLVKEFDNGLTGIASKAVNWGVCLALIIFDLLMIL